MSEKIENIYLKKIQREKKKLEKAAELVNHKIGAIFSGILNNLQNDDPSWALIVSDHQCEIILFHNQEDKLFLNLETGEITPNPLLTNVGKRGLKILLLEVKKRKKKWLRIRERFRKALARAERITAVVKYELEGIGGYDNGC